MRKFQTWTILLSLACGPADAALLSRLSGQAYYDDVLDVTWIADAHLAATNSFGVAGIMPSGEATWAIANEWIAAMNAEAFLGVSDWRLPITIQPDTTCSMQDASLGSPELGYGYGCTGSELGFLFHTTLGNVGQADANGVPTGACSQLPPYCVTNSGPFANLQGHFWSGTLFAPVDGFAWSFVADDGSQGIHPFDPQYSPLIPWAVRAGDIAVVPIPTTALLLGSGLAALWGRQLLRRTAAFTPKCV